MNEEDLKIIEEIKQSIDTDYGSGRRKVQAIENMINLIQKQQEEIDEIAEELGNQYRNHEPCDLYGKMDCKKYKNCKECVKQYFEKKVEEKQC